VDDDAFWAVVEQARRDAGDDAPESVAEAITAVLVERGAAETIAFDEAFHRVSAQGYSWALWGAAYLLYGGCGDDGFDYFRFGLRSLHSRRAGGRLPPPGAGCCRGSRRTSACVC
jgi:hypothetical protein